MTYNEKDILPFWLKHYDKEVGLDNCYVIDHGSDDGSTVGLACNLTRIPRSPFDEAVRSALVSAYCAALLHRYHAVLYTDSDELVVANPEVYPSLTAYACLHPVPAVGMHLGMDIHHAPGEAPLDPRRSVFTQRRVVRAGHPGCKPTLISKPLMWSMGFHLTEDGATFSNLYLFHIAYADDDILRRRQAKRNLALPIGGGEHHRLTPTELETVIKRDLPWNNIIDVPLGDPGFDNRFMETVKPMSTHFEGCMWRIPPSFR